MMKDKTLLASLFLALSLTMTSVSISQEYIAAKEAYKYVGQKKAVCGEVASTYFSVKSRRQPTFLNLEQPYPNQFFTVVIWGSDRHKFKDPPEVFYQGKKICVTGIIETYKGKPQIIVSDPVQITIKSQ